MLVTVPSVARVTEQTEQGGLIDSFNKVLSDRVGGSGIQAGFGGFNSAPPPRNSEVLTKLSRIPSSMENTSIQPNQNMGFTHLQIEWNP
jgi:hypothetical protein